MALSSQPLAPPFSFAASHTGKPAGVDWRAWQLKYTYATWLITQKILPSAPRKNQYPQGQLAASLKRGVPGRQEEEGEGGLAGRAEGRLVICGWGRIGSERVDRCMAGVVGVGGKRGYIGQCCLLLVYSQMSDKGRKRRLRRLLELGYDRESHLLYLPSEKLDEDDMRLIAQDLIKQTDLLVLKISANPIGVQGVRFICAAPWHNLQRLQLKSTKLGRMGAKEIVKGVLPQLVHLRIGFNELGDEGVSHLISGQWPLLNELWLQGNRIGIKGCAALAKANWKLLSHLSLWDNQIDSECCKRILLLAAEQLMKLDLTFCNVKGCQSDRIEELLQKRFTTLTIIE